MNLLHDLTVIDPDGATRSAFLGPIDVVDGPLVLTGIDALNWVGTVIENGPDAFFSWPEHDSPIYAFGDTEFGDDSVALLVSGGTGPDGADLQPRWNVHDEQLSEAFEVEVVRVDADPGDAIERLCGTPERAAYLLDLAGARVTIWAGSGTAMATELAPHVANGLASSAKAAKVLAAAAWTHNLGCFRLVGTDAIPDQHGAAILVGDAARARAEELLEMRSGFDVIGASEPEGDAGLLTDAAVCLGALGGGGVSFAPERPLLVVRGAAAEAARAAGPPVVDGVVIGPGPVEDADRFEGHQWAAAQRRARSAKEDPNDAGGPTLIGEATAIGLIGPHRSIDGHLLATIGTARGWHEVDPALPPVLDPVIAHARAQIAGDQTPMPEVPFSALKTWASQGGFWEDLSSATLPVTDACLIFPYPPTAVDLLRAAVAADGDATRLCELIGPVKSSILSAFGGSHE